MARLVRHTYGKDGIRLAKISRSGDVHTFHDLTVRLMLEGDFSAAYVDGDNSTTLPTDTMRSTAYVVAQDESLDEVERYAEAVIRKLLTSTPRATSGRAEVVEHRWDRMVIDGVEHPHSFRGAPAVNTATVVVERDGPVTVTSGLDELVVAKTTGSSYCGFLTDELTVLAPTDDRILATAVTSSWTWNAVPASYPAARRVVQQTYEAVFAQLDSRAVQQTLHAMATAALDAVPEIEQVSIRMPNRHHVGVDLTPFGRENHNEIFVVTDRPFGVIEGTVARET